MSTASRSVANLVQSAVDVGSVSKAAAPAAAKAVAMAGDTGIAPENLTGSRVFLVNALLDDSDSMRGFESAVESAYSQLKAELAQVAEEEEVEILFCVSTLNKGIIQPYCHVNEAMDLDGFTVNGATPLLGRSKELLGTMLAYVAELSNAGRTAQSFTAIITDGAPTDRKGAGQSSELGNHDPRDLHELISGMTEAKQHIVCGVAIGGGANTLFSEIGINPKWMLDPARDNFAFEAAIRQVSRASRSASKGAGHFQSVANDGFR